MRLHLSLRSERNPVPFNHLPQITGAIHKWIGKNEVHDAVSLYSFSWLRGGRQERAHLKFPQGASFSISAYENNLLKRIIAGIQADPSVNFGLTVEEISIEETPYFSKKTTFLTASPILVKRKVEGREIHYTYQDTEANDLLTETLKTKLRAAGLNEDGVRARFVKDYPGAKTKISYYDKIGNRVNVCPIEIEGSPEQIGFAWNVGMGNSTGIGYGALK